MALAQEQKSVQDFLEKTKIMKNNSLLDLSELIRKHMDKQPELLSMFEPEIK